MSTWFKLLPMELADITEYRDSPWPVKKTDKVLGHLSDEHKALFTMMQRLKQARDLEQVTTKYELDSENLPDRHEHLHELTDKAEAVKHLFWAAVCEDLKIWSVEMPAVRKGWVVVSAKPRPRLPDIMGLISGPTDEGDD